MLIHSYSSKLASNDLLSKLIPPDFQSWSSSIAL